MADIRIANYVKDNLIRGVKLDAIKEALKKTGYNALEIDTAVKEAQDSSGPHFMQRRPLVGKPQPMARKPLVASKTQEMQMAARALQQPVAKKTIWQKIVSFFKQHLSIPEKYRKYVPYVILAILLSIFIYVLLQARTRPPVLEFYDNSTGSPVPGGVYYNGNFVGETQGVFNKLPKDFCKEAGVIELATRQGKVSWPTETTDCSKRELQLIVTLAPVKEVNFFVTLKFRTTDTKSLINGTLIIDGKPVGKIDGTYDIKAVECQTIQILNLTGIHVENNPKNYAEWMHEKDKCENDVINYLLPVYTPQIPIVVPVMPITKPINTTLVFLMQQEVDRVEKLCEGACPTTDCGQGQEAAYCAKYFPNVDLNVNGVYTDYIPFIFGDYGVCEDRLYCSQLINCNCNETGETLDFESCISILCEDLANKGVERNSRSAELKKLLSEGSCQANKDYDQKTSWWTSLQGMLVCP